MQYDTALSSLTSVISSAGQPPCLSSPTEPPATLADLLVAVEGWPDLSPRQALTEIGFFLVRNHGVPQSLTDETFAAAQRFYALPLERRLALRINEHNIGYLPLRGSTIRHSDISKKNRPDLAEGFFVKREKPVDHPDVIANRKFRGANRWPEGLPGFRETVLAYSDALERLALGMLPIYARALKLPTDFFADSFRDPFISTPHYVVNASGEERYSLPFFFDCSLDYPMECLPSCISAENRRNTSRSPCSIT